MIDKSGPDSQGLTKQIEIEIVQNKTNSNGHTSLTVMDIQSW